MKRLLPILALLLVFLYMVNAQPIVFADATFFQAQGKPYLNLDSRIDGSSISWQLDSNGWFTKFDMTIIGLNASLDTIYIDKQRVKSSSELQNADVLHIAVIPYHESLSTLSVKYQDGTSSQYFTAELALSLPPNLNIMSSIVMMDTLVNCNAEERGCHGGLRLQSLPRYVHQSQNPLYVYGEIYDTEVAFVQLEIRDSNDSVIVKTYKKINYQLGSDAAYVIVLETANIPSGHYVIHVVACSASKKNIASLSHPVFVVNEESDLQMLEDQQSYHSSDQWILDIEDEDLRFDLKALLPIINNNEYDKINTMIKKDRYGAQRRYLYNYWKGKYGSNAGEAYKAYHQVAMSVHERFYNSVGFGTETDRGFIFLKYGKPNDMIVVEDDTSAPPYQIWRYNFIDATKQNNVKFLFFNRSLVTNDFELLHSTCRG